MCNHLGVDRIWTGQRNRTIMGIYLKIVYSVYCRITYIYIYVYIQYIWNTGVHGIWLGYTQSICAYPLAIKHGNETKIAKKNAIYEGCPIKSHSITILFHDNYIPLNQRYGYIMLYLITSPFFRVTPVNPRFLCAKKWPEVIASAAEDLTSCGGGSEGSYGSPYGGSLKGGTP